MGRMAGGAGTRRRGRGPAPADLALAAASAGLVLLLLEAGLRLAGFAPERRLATRRMVDAGWTRLLDCYPTNPRGYFDIDLRLGTSRERYRPIAPRRFERIAARHPWAVLSEYNHLRFRDRPPEPRPPGTRRVVVFGDSFTEGQGVKEGDTLVRRLERRLAAGPVEVRNCGRRGLDFPELRDAFEDALAYEPDLLVYALVPNDAERPPDFQARQRYVDDWILDRQHEPDLDEELGEDRRPRLVGLVADRVGRWRVGRETTRWYLEMWTDANPGWARTRQHLREMDLTLASRWARLLVVSWPLLVQLDAGYPFEPVHAAVARFCAEAGIAHHDLLGALRGRPSEDLWVHPVDRHPNEVANALAAASLAPVVRDLLGSPRDAGRAPPPRGPDPP
jgi:lysophospholipase L1-like esterase